MARNTILTQTLGPSNPCVPEEMERNSLRAWGVRRAHIVNRGTKRTRRATANLVRAAQHTHTTSY